MYFDIIMIGDFRFPGGTSTSIASETAILAKAGYRVGLIATAGAVLKYPHPMHPEIRRVLDNGFAELIAPDQSVSCALCLLHHPQVFKQWPHRPWHIEAGQTIMVVHHPLMTASGQPFYDWQKIDTITRDMFGDVRWAPVGPKVREQFSRAVNPPKLFLQDWTNVFDIDEWKVPRTGFMSAQPVIGRHSRPDPLKWPETRSAFFQVYPDDPHFDVRLMGYGTDLEAVVGHPPANWTVLPFKAMPPRDFLGSIDFFVYYHHSEWVEAYGRSILEAMATGAVVVLHPSFRPLFGEGAIYAVPASVQATIRNFHQNPKLFLAQSNRAVDVATEIAGPQVLIDRVAHLIGLPARQKRPAGQVKRPKIMFFTSNGVGMGHLTRSLAVARRLPDSVEPVFLTLSKAFGLVEREGIHAEYLPFHRATGANIDDWNSHLNREVQAAIAFHQPDVFMFDGNVPYYGMLSALEEFPALWRVWMRRGMWAPNSGTTEITREKAFHAVIEPGDIAEIWDRGLTKTYRSKTYPVAPIRYLKSKEALSRAEARKSIGLPTDGLAVLLHLGSGNNFDMTRIRTHILTRLLAVPNLNIVCADWLIGDATPDLPDGVIRLKEYPLSRLLNAFNFSVSAVGYNAFHEVLHAGLPTLFIPNQNPQQDEQHLRAKYARLKGMARVAIVSDLHQADAALDDLLIAETRQEIANACCNLARENGADEVARYLTEMALTRRQIKAE